MNLRRGRLYLGLVAALLGASCAWAGTYIETQGVPDKAGAQAPPNTKYFIAGDRMRTEIGASVIIVRLDKGVTWVLDPARKLYNEMTFDAMKAVTAEARKQAAAKLKTASSEERKAMEQQMRAMGAGDLLSDKPQELEVQYAPEQKTVNGRACKKVVVKLPPLTSEMWVAKDWALDKDAQAFFKLYTEKMAGIHRMPQDRISSEKFYKVDGVPVEETVRAKDASGKEMQATMRTSQVKTQTFGADLFEVPKDFQKVTAPGTGGPGAAKP